MAGENLFSKEHLKTINPDKRDWMEELNLPPQLANFLRNNSREIQVFGVVLLVAILAWSGFQYYLENRREKSTAMLAQAMAVEDVGERTRALEKVVDEYGSTDAGVWARIQLGHLAYDGGDYAKAVANYQEALDELGDDASVAPFVHYAIANAYERQKAYDKAKSHYEKLVALPGFQRQGKLGIARVYEAQGQRAAAADAYQEVLSLDDQGQAGDDAWIQEKVRQLRAPAVAAEGASEKEVEAAAPDEPVAGDDAGGEAAKE